MRVIFPKLAILVALTLIADQLHAQTQPKIIVDQIGTCPSANVLRAFPKVTQPSVGIGTTLTKFPNAELYQSSDRNDPFGQEIPFNAQLIVFGFSPDEKRLFVRVAQNTEREIKSACGWVAADKILLPRSRKFVDRYKLPQPLQMKDISKVHEAAGNLLNVKAVVHNLSISGDATGIDIFEDPRSGTQKGKIRLFDAFLVFDEIVIPATNNTQETRYWLIGTQGKELASLKGWIRQRDVVIWPSRLAVQWNDDVTVSGFASPENLERKRGLLTIPERLERVDYPDQITRRLPVLEQSPSPEVVLAAIPGGGNLEERRKAAQNIIRYYKIATPGNACRKDNPADCISARQIDAQRQQTTAVEKAVMRIDVVILIDATESMDPYLPSTVRTIEKFVKMAEAEDIRNVFDLRFSIALYGDYQDHEASEKKVDYREAVPFFKPAPGFLSGARMLQVLVKNPKALIFRDVHKDKLEAPFAAVIHAAKSAKWRPLKEVPLRFIVHIGDAGNRTYGLTSAQTMKEKFPNATESARTAQSTLRERYKESDVVAALRAADIIYVPVAITEGTTEAPTPTPWNIIFKDQTNLILNLLGIDSPTKRTEISFTRDPNEKLEQKIATGIMEIMDAVMKIVRGKKCQEGCASVRADETSAPSPAIVNLVNRVASVAAGLTHQEIENIYSRDQSIVTMYSPAKSAEGREMFSHWVALERREFNIVRDLLKTLCTSMSQRDSRSPVNQALIKFTEAYSDESFSDLTVREILGKRLGIPNLERTDFSGRSREEIDDAYRAWQSGELGTWNNWHLRACKAMHFTQLMEEDKRIDPEKIECDLATNTCRAPDAAIRKFRWNVEVSHDSPTFYVPLDILP